MNNDFSGVQASPIAQSQQSSIRSIHAVRRVRWQKYRKTSLVILAVVIVIFATIFVINFTRNHKQTAALAANTSTATSRQIEAPVSFETLNKTFQFPLRDKNNVQISTFTYTILDAELTDEIVINGQKYHPIEGKTFLVLDLQITNNYTQSVTMQPRDFVRVTTNNSEERLAPDIYNDPVDVQAISTKPTKLALAIDTNSKDIKLQVGEIMGNKTTIPLTIKY